MAGDAGFEPALHGFGGRPTTVILIPCTERVSRTRLMRSTAARHHPIGLLGILVAAPGDDPGWRSL
jgi:hypothetical protein